MDDILMAAAIAEYALYEAVAPVCGAVWNWCHTTAAGAVLVVASAVLAAAGIALVRWAVRRRG